MLLRNWYDPHPFTISILTSPDPFQFRRKRGTDGEELKAWMVAFWICGMALNIPG